ncbi:glycosyltransferase family 2 protein [Helicobacter muridarum]|uniref:Capsular polysaccharide biosynthsis protein n=1 Tax=Helicobacter muridarum TaxID=216 RepID=A0A377PSX9_9HELI|nr:glycosyltransferase family A protein [Helicobacter muridarum]TLE01093.1 glycosyltransferase family 2 protein [Helicobacter muridarum]STQ85956.1 capsular polysaccharide biosynthsis protein [Helicobacter muridarum]
MPLISIVLPTYNGEEYIEQSIESILNQTYKNIELIIVNDCSTDNTREIIESYANKDNRIKLIHNEINQKLPKSLNIGFTEAKGEYLTWTSDDNYYVPQALEIMLDFLQTQNNYVMVCADYIILRENNRQAKREVSVMPEKLIAYCGIGACFLYRAKVAKEVGLYNEKRFLVEDYEYWLRIGLKGKIGEIHTPLYYYRHHKNSLTSKRGLEIMKNRLELQIEFMDSYFSTYPYILKLPVYNELRALRILHIQGHKSAEEILDSISSLNVSSKALYTILKDYYKATHNKIFLNAIKKLGLQYKIRAYLLKRRVKIIR